MISLISIRKVMGNCIKRKIFEARFTLSVFARMVYVSGNNERFNSYIVKTHNKNQYIYQSTCSIKDSVHTTSSSI